MPPGECGIWQTGPWNLEKFAVENCGPYTSCLLLCRCQSAARFITWRQIYKMLGMERLTQKELLSRSRHKPDDSATAADADADAETGDKQNGLQTDSAGRLVELLPRLSFNRLTGSNGNKYNLYSVYLSMFRGTSMITYCPPQ